MQKDTLWSRIKARRLQTNVYTLAAFIAIFVVSTVLYALVPTGIGGEIFIAISTSLLATIFISFIDIYTQYKNFENKEFIDNLYRFGIHNLHFDKKKLLCELISDAKEEIWISGYRPHPHQGAHQGAARRAQPRRQHQVPGLPAVDRRPPARL